MVVSGNIHALLLKARRSMNDRGLFFVSGTLHYTLSDKLIGGMEGPVQDQSPTVC